MGRVSHLNCEQLVSQHTFFCTTNTQLAELWVKYTLNRKKNVPVLCHTLQLKELSSVCEKSTDIFTN